MRVIVNGESVLLNQAMEYSLLTLLKSLGYLSDEYEKTAPFVVAVNQKIITAAQYRYTVLQEDDCIDILAAVTGG
jgi:thiamine biosynthesis protein ThiS